MTCNWKANCIGRKGRKTPWSRSRLWPYSWNK